MSYSYRPLVQRILSSMLVAFFLSVNGQSSFAETPPLQSAADSILSTFLTQLDEGRILYSWVPRRNAKAFTGEGFLSDKLMAQMEKKEAAQPTAYGPGVLAMEDLVAASQNPPLQASLIEVHARKGQAVLDLSNPQIRLAIEAAGLKLEDAIRNTKLRVLVRDANGLWIDKAGASVKLTPVNSARFSFKRWQELSSQVTPEAKPYLLEVMMGLARANANLNVPDPILKEMLAEQVAVPVRPQKAAAPVLVAPITTPPVVTTSEPSEAEKIAAADRLEVTRIDWNKFRPRRLVAKLPANGAPITVGIFSDTHGSLPELESMLNLFKAQKVTHLLGAGDFISFGGAAELRDVLKTLGAVTGIPKENIYLSPGNWEQRIAMKSRKSNPVLREFGHLINTHYLGYGYVRFGNNGVLVSHYPLFPISPLHLPPARLQAADVTASMARDVPLPKGTDLILFGHTHTRTLHLDPKRNRYVLNVGTPASMRDLAEKPGFAILDAAGKLRSYDLGRKKPTITVNCALHKLAGN